MKMVPVRALDSIQEDLRKHDEQLRDMNHNICRLPSSFVYLGIRYILNGILTGLVLVEMEETTPPEGFSIVEDGCRGWTVLQVTVVLAGE
jgi:hypothetical protein